MALAPRWRKVGRDLTSHKMRTILVVMSIAVGIFAVGVVMGGRGVLTREFDTDYLSSAAPSAEFATGDFDESLVRRIASRHDVVATEARRDVGLRYTDEAVPSSSTAGWQTADVWALPDFSSIRVQKLSPEEATTWPPGPGEIVEERLNRMSVELAEDLAEESHTEPMAPAPRDTTYYADVDAED